MSRMLGTFPEFERAVIRKPIMPGLEQARATGRRLGRPPAPANAGHASPVREARAKPADFTEKRFGC
jgi:DNA invertase Pin-like site-specific DNA recombinase